MNQNRKLVEDWFGAFEAKDVSMLGLAKDFVHSSPFGEIEGRESYLKLIEDNKEAFFANKIEVLDIIEDGEKLCARYTVGGRPACDFFYIEKGKIAKIYSYYHFGEPPNMEGY